MSVASDLQDLKAQIQALKDDRDRFKAAYEHAEQARLHYITFTSRQAREIKHLRAMSEMYRKTCLNFYKTNEERKNG